MRAPTTTRNLARLALLTWVGVASLVGHDLRPADTTPHQTPVHYVHHQ